MSQTSRSDQARTAALARIQRAERNHRLGILAVALFEAVFGLAFLLIMDFRDRGHWLILLAAVLAYGVVLLSVVNLGRYVNAAAHAILQAVLSQQTKDESEKPTA
jgi:uncharacterized membrane protein YjjB (DUF3815 family)